MATVQDVVKAAYTELAALDPDDPLSGGLAQWGLDKINRLINRWNASREAVYGVSFVTGTLTPNLSPHTIGPSGTFTVTSRPVSIDDAMVVINTSTPNVNVPLYPRDAQWYARQPVPTLTSTLPTDLFYNPTWPDGSLYFWPVPTVAYGIRLRVRALLASVALADTLAMPPGYQDALTYTLAEELAPSVGAVSPTVLALVAGKARESRTAIFGNNRVAPRLVTRDSGMPTAMVLGDYNYLTGQIV